MSVIESTKQFAPTGTWAADPVHSNVSFEVAYAGVNTFRGSFTRLHRHARRRPARGLGEGRERRREGRAAERPPPDARLLRRRAVPGDHVQGDRAPRVDDNRVEGKGELTIKGVTQPVSSPARSPAAVDRPVRPRAPRAPARDRDRPHAYGVSWNAPNQSGGNYLGERREAHRRARARQAGGLTMKDPGRFRQPARATRTTRASSARRRGRPEGVEVELWDGLVRPADLRPGSRRRRTGKRPPAPGGLGLGGRDPLRDARVQRLRPRRAEERGRLGVAPEARGGAGEQDGRRRSARARGSSAPCGRRPTCAGSSASRAPASSATSFRSLGPTRGSTEGRLLDGELFERLRLVLETLVRGRRPGRQQPA